LLLALENKGNQAIISCGTGVGVEVGINKFSGIRACLAQDERVAEYARVYDDCNVLCLVGWEVNDTVIDKIMNAWLGAKYDGDEERLKMFETFNTWGGKV
jgi:ribose 5-phosphate isomerase B